MTCLDCANRMTIGQSDVILSNSEFTAKVYSKAFPTLSKRPPRVVYPCVDIEQCQSTKWRKGKGKAVGKDYGVDLIES